MVKIKKAEYILSAAWKSQWPEESFPEMCLAGRSNVGKSSFINAMLSRNGLAKVSSTPGKTRTLNFFNVNDALYFVDVPGYGYAKVDNNVTKQFGKTMDEYISERQTLRGFILLVDYRHKPTPEDIAMYGLYKYYEIPTLVIGTKKDKVNRSQYKKQEKLIKETLDFDEDDVFVAYSSETHEGREEVLEIFEDLIKQYHEIIAEMNQE